MLQGLSLSELVIILLPMAALFGVAALVFQLFVLTVRTAVSNTVWWASYFSTHPVFKAGGRSISWLEYLKSSAWRIVGIGVFSWVFLVVRRDYLELVDEGHLGSLLSFVRSYLLTVTILAFLKASVTVALLLLLLPVMIFWANRSRATWFKRLVSFGSHHAPKAIPLVVYYGLLVVIISLVLTPHIFASFPFDMSWENFGELLQRDFKAQLLEFRSFLFGLFLP